MKGWFKMAKAEQATKAEEPVKFELTGRKRYRRWPKYFGMPGAYDRETVLILEMEEHALTTVGGITAMETRWREAKAEDVPNETVNL